MTHRMILMLVMAVPLVVWFGLFFYLLIIDRAMHRLENNQEGNDSI